jgi:myo-inositol 2-dehydrogenase/D-chiro-inositol 1-dehydrogenase
MSAERTGMHTRRDFIGSAGAAAAGAAMGLSAVPRVLGSVRADDRIRVGLIGCGGRGTGAAAQALEADPGVVIWALGDAFQDRMDSCLNALSQHEAAGRVQVPRERQFAGIDVMDGVLAEVDVVLLCSPPVFRPAQLAKAVAAGKHVFCEKPMCIDGPGYRSVIESARIARERRLALVSGFCWRYSSPERALFGELMSGRAGDVVGVECTYLTSPLGVRTRRPEWSDLDLQVRNWQHFNWLSGDHIVEQAVHSIDKMAWAMGGRMPASCYAVGSRFTREEIPERGDIYDNFAVLYEYADGPRNTLMCRQQANCFNDNTDHITLTRGFAFINGWGPTLWIRDLKGNPVWSWPSGGESPNMYQVEHDELFRSIRQGRPINDGLWMADSCLMAIMGRMAAYTGRKVTWDEARDSTESLLPTDWTPTPRPVPPVRKPGVDVT